MKEENIRTPSISSVVPTKLVSVTLVINAVEPTRFVEVELIELIFVVLIFVLVRPVI